MRRTLLALILSSIPFVALAQEAAPEDTTASAAPAALSVSEVTVCRAVENRAPVDAADSFTSDIGSLYCFAKVEGATAPAQTYHRWYVGDTMVREISITVKTSPYRCWSQKSIQPGWSGECRVDVVNESGDVLGSKSFTLTPGPAAEPQG